MDILINIETRSSSVLIRKADRGLKVVAGLFKDRRKNALIGKRDNTEQ